MQTKLEFPHYTAAEKIVDAAIHVLGLAGASIALPYLLVHTGPTASSAQLTALVVYALGLMGMLSASALYNVAPAGRLKAILRQLDHVMIFVMIAGSYTPFALIALPPGAGVPLCVAIWSLAVIGVGLRVAWARIYTRISLVFYLGMGWLALVGLPPLVESVSRPVLVLLLTGGIIYSLGSLVHARLRMPFHNAAWHAMVVAAAALHLAAIAQLPL